MLLGRKDRASMLSETAALLKEEQKSINYTPAWGSWSLTQSVGQTRHKYATNRRHHGIIHRGF